MFGEKRKLVLLFVCFTLHLNFVLAQINKQEKPPVYVTRILFIFDASLSMTGRWQSDTKISIANRIISNMLDSLKDIPNLELALRVFGHQKYYPPQDCDDSKLEVPFGQNNALKIKQRLKSIHPRGTTPITISLERAANDFPDCNKCRNIIILITDGIEECGGDPCAASLALQKKGIVLKPFIIGIGRNFRQQYECVGTYFDGSTELDFQNALKIVISQVLNNTTCQVNLLDIYNNPTETNVNMTFFDASNNAIRYNFIHTIDSKGNPDTLLLDPLSKYYVKVNTIPPVFSDTFSLIPGKHKIVGVSAPQGYLELKMAKTSNTISLPKFQCIVRKHNDMQTLNVQTFETKEKYLVGKYDLEILSLPRVYIRNVSIDQSKTTIVEIPEPGTLQIQYPSNGYGSMYVYKDGELEWFYNISTNQDREFLNLMPGNYLVVFRAYYHNRSIYTIERKFTIESGKTTRITLSNK